MTTEVGVEDLLRQLAPQVLGALVRRYGHFDACEDAVQEALLAATRQWPTEGMPQSPRGWLITVASRRLTDQLRRDESRRRREETTAARASTDERQAPPADDDQIGERDDTLTVLFLCCHPALTPASQVALTLRAVGGLSTAEIARAFLVPETTMAQRISRAKQRIKDRDLPFGPSDADDPTDGDDRLPAALQVLYLIFNEGYTTSSGPDLQRPELASEAIRLTRAVHRLRPSDGEVAGLLALMLLTDARRAARTAVDGSLVPLAEQDRARWDGDAIAEGVALITETLSSAPLGPYQLEAAIAAVHDEAQGPDDTDWPQILGLYDLLARIAPNPMVTLNRAVALAMVAGPAAGLDAVDALADDDRMSTHHRLDVVRAHLLEMAGDTEAARTAFRTAARRTTSLPERRYLESRAARLT